MRTLDFSLNGRVTARSVVMGKVIHALTAGSVTENSATNAWNLNFSNGTLNNNNKNNTNVVRAVCALGEKEVDGWVDAYFDCISNKRTAPQCDRYRANYEEDLWRLMNEVYSRTYQPSKSLCFVVTRPRLREIFAASFRDRVVQHWIIRRIDPLFEERFKAQGDVSFNCRKGYGSMKAVERLAMHIEEVSNGYRTEAWIGKFDIKSFFMSIDKEVLFRLLIPFVKELYKGEDIDTLLWLLEVVLLHCPQTLCERRSRPELWESLSPSKSLFNAPSHIGLAIGNITSQIIANFYLSFFDEWVVKQCDENGARYIRFVDDWAIVAQDKDFIIQLHKSAGEWLKTHLHLALHADKFYLQPVTHGVKFVGQVIKPHRRYTANRTVSGFHRRAHQTNLLCGEILRSGLDFDRAARLEHLVDALNSYGGFLTHTASYRIRKRVFDSLTDFWHFCYIKGHYNVVCLRKEYKFTNYLSKQFTR